MLGLLAVLALTLPRFLPFYDLGEWTLQGAIVHDLLAGSPQATASYAGNLSPVPNLLAPLAIGLLGFVMPIEAAVRVLLVAGVLGFAAGYAFLVRRLQGRPTCVEYTGLLWAFGYFLQRGYVSYLFALPIAFTAIALVHPVLRTRPSWGRLTALAVLGAVAFLAHLVAWGVLLVALAADVVVLVRGGRRRDAAGIAVAVVPGLVLLAWYVLARPAGGNRLEGYLSLRDKGLSLAEALELFPRLDPFPGVVPVFAAQVLVLGALLVVLVRERQGRAVRAAPGTPVVVAGAVLAALAVLDPIGNVDALTKPDQRLLFPAVLLVLAGLPWRDRAPGRALAVAGVVAGSLVLHAVAVLSTDAPLAALAAGVERAVPPGVAVTTLAVPSDGGCRPGWGPTIGIPALKWFDVGRRLRDGDLRADLQETSGVTLRFDPVAEPGLATRTPPSSQAAEAVQGAGSTDWVEIFACPADAARAAAALAPTYRTVATGEGYAVLRRSG